MDWFYGIYGIRIVWHGEWADPELIWHRRSFNYYDLEDAMWDAYRDECKGTGTEVSDDQFPAWVKKNASLARSLLQDIMSAA